MNTLISKPTHEVAKKTEAPVIDIHPGSPVVWLVTACAPDVRSVCLELGSQGFGYVVSTFCNEAAETIGNTPPEIVVLDVATLPRGVSGEIAFISKLKRWLNLPVIVLIPSEDLDEIDWKAGMDDFILKPCCSGELSTRIRRALWRASDMSMDNIIKSGDLVIDLHKYEVMVAGRHVNLSFKEYELLRVLALNKDRVLTREALLDKVWGYDYFGGDRTVDVHIRRLRSKIEDVDHSFIETVRNVGYRFKGGE